MFVSKITLKYGRKINLGDYNSLDLSVMPTIQVEEDDNLDEVLREVWAMCRQNLEHAARPVVAAYRVGNEHGVTQEELFLGLPVHLQERTEEVGNAD